MAEEEAASFPKDKYDTYIRGVSAYSTLGWFQDSVLSTMLRYEDYELAEVIIHETVHTTLFIKSAAEFNERMATFLGQEGMKLFYEMKQDTKVLSKAADDAHDQKLFSSFISRELESLKKWYIDNAGQVREKKPARLQELKTRFVSELKPKLKTDNYREFEKRELTNALLLAYQTYEYNLDDFQKLYDHFNKNFQQTMAYLQTLQKDEHPDQTLKKFVNPPPNK